jgi:hypothetical protein
MDWRNYEEIKKNHPEYYQHLLKDTGNTDEERFKELQMEKKVKKDDTMFVATIILLVIAGVTSVYGVIVSL